MAIVMNSILTYALMNMLASTVPTVGWQGILLGMVELIPPYTLVPRFILSLRKLYARDIRGRHGRDIDTAFGFTSASDHGAAVSTIMFVDGRQDEGEEQSEEIQMEDREIRGAGSSA